MNRIEAEASAPASSANLGPGFDCMALALELRCRVKAKPSQKWEVLHTGSYKPPQGSSDAVLAGARSAVGNEHPIRLLVDNRIPIGSGLGSSAAAYAAGMVAAFRCVGEPINAQRVFRSVTALEGHPDNAAATVFGGLVLVDAEKEVHRLGLSPNLGHLVLVPTFRLFTNESRRVVPKVFEVSTVINGLSRMGALVVGLTSGRADLLRSALGDEIHESSRNRLQPLVGEFIDVALGAGAVYAAWSGSGPSVLVFTESAQSGSVADGIRSSLGDRVQVLTPRVAEKGIL
jgi:homoserine kinase